MTSAATATSDVATEKVIMEGVDGAGVGHDVSQRNGGRARRLAGRHRRAAWCRRNVGRRDLAFDEGIAAGFLIGRSVADSKELTAKGDFIVASAIGEEAIMADAMEAVRQGVQEKATNELIGIERHHLGFAILPIVLPGKLTLPSASETSRLLAMATRCV